MLSSQCAVYAYEEINMLQYVTVAHILHSPGGTAWLVPIWGQYSALNWQDWIYWIYTEYPP